MGHWQAIVVLPEPDAPRKATGIVVPSINSMKRAAWQSAMQIPIASMTDVASDLAVLMPACKMALTLFAKGQPWA